jgi:hypothetical protein
MLDRRTFLGAAAASPAVLLAAGTAAAQRDDRPPRRDRERDRDDRDRDRDDRDRDVREEDYRDEERVTYRAKQILGSKVSIDDNQSVGTVDDIVMDEHGNVDYLIVVDKNRKLVSIPWDAAQFNPEERVANVHISQEKYQQVPTYTVEQYPTFAAPAYRTQTYQYFGLRPGQQRRLMRRGGVVITK